MKYLVPKVRTTAFSFPAYPSFSVFVVDHSNDQSEIGSSLIGLFHDMASKFVEWLEYHSFVILNATVQGLENLQR